MKRYFAAVLIFILLIITPFCIEAKSGAVLIIDGRTGQILEGENYNQRMPMASTTKIMTALVVLKKAKLSDSVKIPAEAVGVEGSSLYIKLNEIYTVEELLFGLMLRSANDCAVALACHVGGNVEKFADMMNDEAKLLGLTDTQFKNPNGLPQEGHYTTAYELAMIMKTAMEIEDFCRITAAKQYTIKGNTITNHNRLLWMYSECVGGKTGYTIEAGRCLVSVAKKDTVSVICVTLGRGDDWNIHISTYEKWFERLKRVNLAEIGEFEAEIPLAGTGNITVTNSNSVDAMFFEEKPIVLSKVFAGPFIYGNKEKGDVVGTVEFWFDGAKVGESPLVIDRKIETPVKKELFISRIIRFFRGLFLKKQ